MCRITELLIAKASIWPAHGIRIVIHRSWRGIEQEWIKQYSPAQLLELSEIDAEIERLRHSASPLRLPAR